MALGQAAFVADRLVEAERWLDRARRIAGGNDAIELLLATIHLRLGDAARATQAFAELAGRHDLREAWLGLAAAYHNAGATTSAAQALTEALAGHVGSLPPRFAELADSVSKNVGAAGWCYLANEGEIRVSPVDLQIWIELDGERVASAPRPLLSNAATVSVVCARGQVLGSPLQLDRMRRLEGFVEVLDSREGASSLSGWAWHPNDPLRIPVLRATGSNGSIPVLLDVSVRETSRSADRHDRPLTQTRHFRVDADALPGDGLIHIIGPDGGEITGSPLDINAFSRYAAAVAGALAPSPQGHTSLRSVLLQAPVPAAYVGLHQQSKTRPPGVAIVIPVYRGLETTLACLDSVFAHTCASTAIIVVDDAGPDRTLSMRLDALATAGRIRLLRHAHNRGFPSAANSGMIEADTNDVILLNADTLVSSGWLERLQAAAHAAPNIATATPLSNNATLLSYPRQEGGNPLPSRATVDKLARLADRANRGIIIDIPTAVGFCMYIRRDCLDQVGPLREDAFAQGYGEENDFCLRARHLGWRHVAAAGVFVGHVGGVSFGAATARLLTRNLSILNRLHPGYDALIAEDTAGPFLATARRRIDLARLGMRRLARDSVVLITHDLGGGVQRQVNRRAAKLRADGLAPIVIKPVLARPLLQGTGACTVELDGDFANLTFDIATEMQALAKLLRRHRPVVVEVHHMLGHDHALMGLPGLLGVPYEVHIHDYAWFCPRVSLLGFERRYCGEPDIAGCEACVADAGRNIDDEIPVADLVARSTADLAGATRVVAPSQDVARRCARHFPGLQAEVRGWDDSVPPPRARPLPPPNTRRPRIVGVLGAIGLEKGYDVLLACARDAAARQLPIRFIVLGHTTDDARLLATGKVFITGEYQDGELPGLIAAHGVDLAFLPSIWPETWCFTLSEAWDASLRVFAFDIGAPAERIRAKGGGSLLPLGCRAPQINDVLVG